MAPAVRRRRGARPDVSGAPATHGAPGVSQGLAVVYYAPRAPSAQRIAALVLERRCLARGEHHERRTRRPIEFENPIEQPRVAPVDVGGFGVKVSAERLAIARHRAPFREWPIAVPSQHRLGNARPQAITKALPLPFSGLPRRNRIGRDAAMTVTSSPSRRTPNALYIPDDRSSSWRHVGHRDILERFLPGGGPPRFGAPKLRRWDLRSLASADALRLLQRTHALEGRISTGASRSRSIAGGWRPRTRASRSGPSRTRKEASSDTTSSTPRPRRRPHRGDAHEHGPAPFVSPPQPHRRRRHRALPRADALAPVDARLLLRLGRAPLRLRDPGRRLRRALPERAHRPGRGRGAPALPQRAVRRALSRSVEPVARRDRDGGRRRSQATRFWRTSDRPSVRYFLEQNPDYNAGRSLAILVPVGLRTLWDVATRVGLSRIEKALRPRRRGRDRVAG